MASNNQINVQLNFTANTAEAKKNIESLQSTLNQLAIGNSSFFKADATTAEIQKVSKAAAELQYHLSNSLDANGVLNLKKFDASLKTTGTNINQLSSKLISAGAGGAQAFVQLSTAVSQASIQTQRLSGWAEKAVAQFKRAAAIQLSTSAYNAVADALKSGYEYAQKLNKSLNDIRIVSGQNAEQMAAFARQANKTAQALSATTTAYADASLIYFQQGLDEQEVIDRTNVTIKMANVTGDSAQTVSDQMTAIWNNFVDGSKSLEYYADVLTALGAATASSTDEIAAGVEKFAAIGKVTGLSYEYATAALATLIDRTRQSADTIGTSLRTIFSRLQGLSLGETLDDGVNLNKYSKALATVGVQVLDTNGQMRDMDTILTDLAGRWNDLSQGQKMALAQTVAGVRQYNNLISLMDNWDFMQENLQTAYNSEGTIQEQADIYAESWEAARTRTKAALEDIYNDLIDDQVFIKIQDYITGILKGINQMIENIGGFKGVLLIVASILASKIQPVMTKLSTSMMMAFAKPETIYKKNNQVFSDNVNQMKQSGDWNKLSTAQQTQLEGNNKVANARANYMAVQSKLNTQEQQMAEVEIGVIEMTVAHLVELGDAYDNLVKKRDNYVNSLNLSTGDAKKSVTVNPMTDADINEVFAQANVESNITSKKKVNKVKTVVTDFNNSITPNMSMADAETQLDILKQKLQDLNITGPLAQKTINDLYQAISKKIDQSGLESYKEQLDNLQNSLDLTKEQANEVKDSFEKIANAGSFDQATNEVNELVQTLFKFGVGKDKLMQAMKGSGFNTNQIKSVGKAFDEVKEKEEQLGNETKNLDEKINSLSFEHTTTALESFGQITSIAINASMALNSLKSACDDLSNPDLSGFEKFSSAMMALSLSANVTRQTLTSVKSIVSGLSPILLGSATLTDMLSAEQAKNALIIGGQTDEQLKNILTKELGMETDKADIVITELKTAADDKQRKKLIENYLAERLNTLATDAGTKSKLMGATATKVKTLAETKNITIMKALTLVTLKYIAIAAVLAAAIYFIVKAIASQETAQEKANRELQEAKNQTENLKTASEDAATAVSNLKDSYEGFTSAQDKLSTLVKGTTEWKEALLDANQATLDLIDNVPELAKYLVNDGGVLTFKDGYEKVYDEALNQALERQSSVASGLIASKNTEIRAQSEADYYNSVASKGKLTYLQGTKIYKDTNGTIYDSLKEAEEGTGYGYIGYEETTSARNLTKDEYDKIRKALSGEDWANVIGYNENTGEKQLTDDFLKELNFSDQTNDLLQSNIDVIENIYDQLNQEQTSLDANTTALLANVNSQNEDYNDSGVQQSVDKAEEQLLKTDNYFKDYKKYDENTEQSTVLDDYLSNFLGLKDYTTSADGTEFIDGSYKYKIDDGKLARYKKGDDGKYTVDDSFEQTSYNAILETINDKARVEKVAELTPSILAQNEAKANRIAQDLIKQGYDAEKAQAIANKAVNSGNIEYNFNEDYTEVIGANLKGIDSNGISEQDASALYKADVMSNEDYKAYQEARRNQRFKQSTNWNNAEEDAQALLSAKEALGLTDEAVEAYTQSLIENNKELQKHQENADDVAQQMLTNRVGYDKLTKAITDNAEALEEGTESPLEYAEAIGDIQVATNDWLGTDFSSDEIIENLELIQKAAEGDEEAIRSLQDLASKKNIANFDVSNDTKDKLLDLKTTADQYLANKNYEIGVNLEGQEDFTNALDALMASGEMTAEEMNKYLSGIGFEPDIEWENIDLNGQSISEVKVGDELNLPGGGTFTVTQEALTRAQNTGTFAIPRINAKSTAYAGPKSGGGSPVKKSGGGGGGGSKKTKEKKPADNKDRYHTVDQQLEDLSNQLDELGDAEDRAFGAEKIKVMAREMGKLNDQVAKYNDKLVEAQNYLTQDRAKAEGFASKIGMSLQYGANGEILNWDELKKGYLDWYNAGVDKYNAGGIDDDAFSKQYDDVYSDAMDAFDQLEETNNLVQELKQNILDTQRQYEDMYLAIQKEKLELNITIDENGMKILEYFFDKLDDDLYDSIDRMATLEDQLGNLIDQASAYENNINDLLGTAGEWDGLNFNSYGLSLADVPDLLSKSNKELYEIFGGAGSNVQEIIDQLQNDYENLLDTNKEIADTRKSLIEEIGNSFESWNDELDKAEERLEDNASLMEHYRNVIDIVGRKTLGITASFIKDYNTKQLDNDLAQLSASYAQLNEQRKAVSALEEAIMRETSEETRLLMQKELDDMRDALNEQVEDTAQKWEDCMRGIQEAYEDTVSVALDDWQTKMAGLAGSADMLKMSFEMATDIDDNYLDDYDKIYELSKLSADINNSIDDTDNLQSKEDLIALMEKVNELNESDADISQYTVDVLRARYELLKAEDALKEAQNAKSTVRLTQDNEGNWGYLYVADQDAVSQAEQEYADKLHALEEINQNYINDLDQKLADLAQNASDKINQIAQDSTLTLEEKKQKIQEVYEYTNEMERYLMEQTKLALEDAMEIYDVDAQKYSELTNNKMLDDEKWVNSFEEMKIAQITGFTELQDWDQQFSDSWDDTVRNLITTTDEFVEKNAEAFETVKMDIKDASEEMGEDLDQIAEDTNNVRDSILDMGADAEQTITSVIDYAKSWSDEWSLAIDAIISKNEQLAKSCDTIITKLADAQAANDALNQAEAERANASSDSGSSGSSSSSSSSGGGSYTGGGSLSSPKTTCVSSCSGTCQDWCGGNSCESGCKSCQIGCSQGCKNSCHGECKNTASSNSMGCFAPNTKVLMADLTEKEIQYIKLDDMVMSYDEKTQIFMPKRVMKIYPHYNTPRMIKITFQNNTYIELTPGHPILSQDGWRSLDIINSLVEHGVIAKELQYSDIILGYNNNYNIQLIQELNIGDNYTSYNLEVEDYHTFITNEIIAHNKKMNVLYNPYTFDTGGYTGTFQYADTGMYTGEWANGSVRANGRLAFLHQKELVLNAHDTENFLQAVDIVRNLNESLDLGALSMSKGLGNITARGLDQNTAQTIDQNVSIQASFPNVQDRNEIEEAFNNLINKASQYANRKNK